LGLCVFGGKEKEGGDGPKNLCRKFIRGIGCLKEKASFSLGRKEERTRGEASKERSQDTVDGRRAEK